MEILTSIAENVAGEFIALLLGAIITGVFVYLRNKGLLNIGKGRLTSSPDHTKVASESGGEIYVMDRDGARNVTRHPALDKVAIWSPDSTKIAFMSERDGTWQAWVVKDTGGRAAKLTSGFGESRPIRWDEDGNLIVRLGGSFLTVYAYEIEKRLA